jgi:hypothetical protein
MDKSVDLICPMTYASINWQSGAIWLESIKEQMPEFPVERFMLEMMGLSALEAEFKVVPRDNRAGGVGYHWYFAAGQYIKKHPGLAPAEVQENAQAWARKLSTAVRTESAKAKKVDRDDWDDLRDYIRHSLTLGDNSSKLELRSPQTEFVRYASSNAKDAAIRKSALCSSPYRVDKQREAAICSPCKSTVTNVPSIVQMLFVIFVPSVV